MGAATAESGKAKRVLFWVRGHGHDFGHIYLAGHGRSQKGRAKLIPVAENCRGMRVIAFKPLGPGPTATELRSHTSLRWPNSGKVVL